MVKNPVLEAINRLEKRMDLGFDKVGQRFEQINQRFEGVDGKIEGLDKKISNMELNIYRLEHKMDEGFTTVNGRLAVLEEFRRESMNRFDHIFKKLELFGEEYHSITYGIKRIEDDHRIISHAEILREINLLKAGKNSS